METTPGLGAAIAAIAGLTVRTDRRGVPYVQTTVRVTGPAHIAILAALAEQDGSRPAAVCTDLVNEELRYIGIPGAREQVRRSRARRRARYDPHRDTR